MMTTDQSTYASSPDAPNTEGASWPACLMVVQGTEICERIVLNKRQTTIGRAEDMDICLTHAGVSRKHAIIERLGKQQFLLLDKDSTNGTFVNSKHIKSVLLNDQDLISIGECWLKFIASDSPEQPYYHALYHQAHMDKALQIFNKHYFLLKLDEEVERCNRYGNPLSLILFDVDHFKRLNDTHGHLAGDSALINLAETLKKRIRNTDVLCRYGGEEFAVIMPQTNQQHASILAEHIRALIEQTTLNHDGTMINMTISLGVSGYVKNDLQIRASEALIAQADQALYQAKQSGRNRVVVFGS